MIRRVQTERIIGDHDGGRRVGARGVVARPLGVEGDVPGHGSVKDVLGGELLLGVPASEGVAALGGSSGLLSLVVVLNGLRSNCAAAVGIEGDGSPLGGVLFTLGPGSSEGDDLTVNRALTPTGEGVEVAVAAGDLFARGEGRIDRSLGLIRGEERVRIGGESFAQLISTGPRVSEGVPLGGVLVTHGPRTSEGDDLTVNRALIPTGEGVEVAVAAGELIAIGVFFVNGGLGSGHAEVGLGVSGKRHALGSVGPSILHGVPLGVILVTLGPRTIEGDDLTVNCAFIPTGEGVEVAVAAGELIAIGVFFVNGGLGSGHAEVGLGVSGKRHACGSVGPFVLDRVLVGIIQIQRICLCFR